MGLYIDMIRQSPPMPLYGATSGVSRSILSQETMCCSHGMHIYYYSPSVGIFRQGVRGVRKLIIIEVCFI